MIFTMAADQEGRQSLRIGVEKYFVAGNPGVVRCNNGHFMERVSIYHINRSDDQAYFLNLACIIDNSSRLSTSLYDEREIFSSMDVSLK